METDKLFEKLSPIFRKYWIPIILGILGLIFLGYGLIGLMASKSSDEFVLDKNFNNKDIKFPKEEAIVVDIEGAIISPGVYNLPKDARVKDLLVKAGGLSQTADRIWFAKNINLASKLSDGGKIYVPSQSEVKSGSPSVEGVSTGITSNSGLININTASSSQLDSLSGVGPVTAAKIIQNRPYQTINDLTSKKIIGSKVFSQIKDKISTY